MQSMKFQTELTTGIAIKAGVPIPKKNQKRIEPQEEEEQEEECEDCESEEENQEEENQEEETEEEHENKEEEVELTESQEEDEKGNPIIRDLDKPSKLVRIHAPRTEVETPKKKKSSKLKAYQKLASIITDYPLPIKDLTEKYEEEFGTITKKELWKALSYATTKGTIKKHLVGENPNRYIYATPEMYDGNELKKEYQS
jgi:hypothetical protein